MRSKQVMSLGELVDKVYVPRSFPKACKKCGRELTSLDFHEDLSKPDGLRRICKACQAEVSKAHQIRTRELRSYRDKYRREQ